jgi:glyoxylase-like metal-dependent hydrolase (beta-lactamase superfamily II)
MSEEMPPVAPEQLSDLVWKVRAPNPSPMTLDGTNSYLVGKGDELIAIDPGPKMEKHLNNIVAVARGMNKTIKLILVTHGHPDHFPGAAMLAELTGAPVAAYHEATFPHDIKLKDGEIVSAAGVNLHAIFTPGHAVDHLCFYLVEEKALFTGDNILGIGTTIVAPPKGNMIKYLNSLRLLQNDWAEARVIYGGHGPAIHNPPAKIQEYLDHRAKRENMAIAALQAGAETIPQVVEKIYQDVDKRLWPAAARQVQGIFNKLETEGRVISREGAPPTPEEDAILYPEGIVDPVAVAELGISTEKEKNLKHYTLVDSE